MANGSPNNLLVPKPSCYSTTLWGIYPFSPYYSKPQPQEK